MERFSADIEREKAETTALLEEGDFLLYIRAHRQYAYCNLTDATAQLRALDEMVKEFKKMQIAAQKVSDTVPATPSSRGLDTGESR